jgi:type IV secretion system protein VirB10
MSSLIKDNLPPAPPVVELPQPPLPVQQGRATNDLQELILASKMEADDVKLDNNAENAEAAAARRSAGSQGGEIGGAEAFLKEAMNKSDKMVDRMLAAESGGAKAQGQSKSAQEVFLEDSAARTALPVERLQEARPTGTLYQGSIIRLVLDGALRSDLPGMVRARVVSDVYDSINFADLLIPRGSSVDCRYQSAILVGQSRMLLGCERIRMPNGKFIKLPGNPASDMEGASGVPAEVDTHFWTRFGSVLMMGAASTLLPSEDKTVTLSSNAGGTTQASTVLGNTLNQVITQTMSRNASIGPTGYIEPGAVFTVVTISDLQLEPYKGRSQR